MHVNLCENVLTENEFILSAGYSRVSKVENRQNNGILSTRKNLLSQGTEHTMGRILIGHVKRRDGVIDGHTPIQTGNSQCTEKSETWGERAGREWNAGKLNHKGLSQRIGGGCVGRTTM